MRTATISIDVPAERYWPKSWERPADGLPQFRATEPTPGRAGMEVLQDGEWVALPSKAALHIRVMTVQVGELRALLRRAHKLVAADLDNYFDKEGDRIEDYADFDLTEPIALVDEIDAVLK